MPGWGLLWLQGVCKRRKLNPAEHDLRHQRKPLDRSLTVRFAGLSSNAMLELVAGRGPVAHYRYTTGTRTAVAPPDGAK